MGNPSNGIWEGQNGEVQLNDNTLGSGYSKAGNNPKMAPNTFLLTLTPFDLHPPIHIDRNFGWTAGIIEMLLQPYL